MVFIGRRLLDSCYGDGLGFVLLVDRELPAVDNADLGCRLSDGVHPFDREGFLLADFHEFDDRANGLFFFHFLVDLDIYY